MKLLTELQTELQTEPVDERMLVILYTLLILVNMNSYKLRPIMSSTVVLRRYGSVAENIPNSNYNSNHLFSVAPMMDYTNKHQRCLQRMITKYAVLYTEMVTTNAILRNLDDNERFIGADFDMENPVVLQLGGSSPLEMKQATKVALEYGYKEININIGCPSPRVAGKGCFGAALMLQPELVGDISTAVGEVIGKPPTIKCRIGVNEQDTYEQLVQFIDIVKTRGQVNHFIIHARKAIIDPKFSPDDNRKIPPLKYDFVYQLIKDFPAISFSINGGIQTVEEVQDHLSKGVNGVMVGRAVISNPFYWRRIDSTVYRSNDPVISRREIIDNYLKYAEKEEQKVGSKIKQQLVSPVLNLFHGEPNGKLFRREMDRFLRMDGMTAKDIIYNSAKCLSDDVLDAI